ncbi:MAG: hypothetical protein DRI57_16040 [Deltaproteobacteria bacterium]|nr:MAG: hypothetical protein DRI57_16040 [Deltaproteobacteria bacterium]
MKANLSDILEGLFWFVIFAVWLISRFRQQPKKKAKEAPVPPPLSESSSGADNQRTQKEEKQTPAHETFKLLKGGLRGFLEEMAKMQQGGQMTPPQNEQADWEQAHVAPKPVKTDVPRPKPEEPSPEPESRPRRLPTMRLNLSRKGLRQGVLFREILGPPVALREEEKQF